MSNLLKPGDVAGGHYACAIDRLGPDHAGVQHIRLTISLGPLAGLEGINAVILDDLAQGLAGLLPAITAGLRADDKRLELAADDARLELDAGVVAALELEAPRPKPAGWLRAVVLELLELARQCRRRPSVDVIAAVDGVQGIGELTALERLHVARVMLDGELDVSGDLQYARQQLQAATVLLERRGQA